MPVRMCLCVSMNACVCVCAPRYRGRVHEYIASPSGDGSSDHLLRPRPEVRVRFAATDGDRRHKSQYYIISVLEVCGSWAGGWGQATRGSELIETIRETKWAISFHQHDSTFILGWCFVSCLACVHLFLSATMCMCVYVTHAMSAQDEVRLNGNDTRSLLYLGTTYQGVGNLTGALHAFERLAAVTKWDEEAYHARISAAEVCAVMDAEKRGMVVSWCE